MSSSRTEDSRETQFKSHNLQPAAQISSATHSPSQFNTSLVDNSTPENRTITNSLQMNPQRILQNKSHARPNSMSTTTTLTTINDQVPPVHSPISSISRPTTSTLLSFSALALSIFLVALDTVLIPTALASIALDFHIPDSLYAWTGSAYLLANAASIPLWGRLSDVFGRKPIILIANAIFLVGSVIGACSQTAEVLILGRAVQGLGGGGVNVLVYVCVADLFVIRDRSFYMGIVGAVYAVASALGPVLGGVFAQKLNWRWCFYINIPLVSIAIITLYFTIRLPGADTPFVKGLTSLDWFGNLTILTATLLLLVGLQLGGTASYASPSTLTLMILGILTYFFFPFTQWLAEKRHTTPLTPLRIFRDISNLSALSVCACDAFVFNSVAYFLPLYFQLVLARSPSTSGVYMLAIAIPLATVSFLAGYIINKTGRYLEVLQCGLFLMTVGVGLLITFTARLDIAKIIGFLLIIGIGFGPNFHAPLIALQTRIAEADMAAATAAFGFVRMVSGAVGVVVGQVAFQLLIRREVTAFTEAGIDAGSVDALMSGEAIASAGIVGALREDARLAVRQGMAGALRGVWGVYCGISALGLLISFGIARGRIQGGKNGDREAVDEKGRTGDTTNIFENRKRDACRK